MISHNSMHEFASAEVFARYDHLALIATLANLPKFRYCFAQGCRSGQIHDEKSDKNKVFRCNECVYQYCILHNVGFHTGETCTAYDERKRDKSRAVQEQEETSAALVELISKPCRGPDCGFQLERQGGRDHITCKLACEFQFCWLCSAPCEPP
ncbi:hypothetical protein EJ02DRAFT_486534, partial [Clathrospora elynae]